MFWAAVTLWSALRPSLSIRAHSWPPRTSGTSGVGTCGEGQRGLDPRPRLLLRVQTAACWGPGPLSAQWAQQGLIEDTLRPAWSLRQTPLQGTGEGCPARTLDVCTEGGVARKAGQSRAGREGGGSCATAGRGRNLSSVPSAQFQPSLDVPGRSQPSRKVGRRSRPRRQESRGRGCPSETPRGLQGKPPPAPGASRGAPGS